MDELITQIQSVWPLVMQAPWGFLSASLALLILGWAAGRFMYGERIFNLKSRIERRDDEIAELKKQSSDKEEGDGTAGKNFLIGRLIGQYLHEHKDAPRRMQMGLEQPPVDWVNAELAKLEEDWRVKTGRNGEYVFYDLPRWG
ncbi:hypothetical protein NKI79_05410 [Mesorhizobium sp. M0340]|uniref:hypothetical protein n=1 Tax=Mesorhizobium sp. M0340 TaxID=2956939 RepID=UPI00333D5238